MEIAVESLQVTHKHIESFLAVWFSKEYSDKLLPDNAATLIFCKYKTVFCFRTVQQVVSTQANISLLKFLLVTTLLFLESKSSFKWNATASFFCQSHNHSELNFRETPSNA